MSGMNDGFTIHGILKSMTPLHMGAQGAAPIPDMCLAAPKDDSKKSNRCACCSKKLMLSHLGCSKCGTRYCDSHRLPELHACPHDFKKEGQALLAKQNPRVIGYKMERC